jgi:hypothetical protein
VGTVDDTVDSGEWVGLAEAGRRLGISEKTARRRVKAGRLQARQMSTQHGPTWQVWVPTGVDATGRVDSTGTQAATMLELVRLVGELQAKAEASAMWQARAELLAHQLGEAHERIRMLEAPREPEPEPIPEPVPETGPWSPPKPGPDGPVRGPSPPPPEGGSVPWWRRWWGWLNGA